MSSYQHVALCLDEMLRQDSVQRMWNMIVSLVHRCCTHYVSKELWFIHIYYSGRLTLPGILISKQIKTWAWLRLLVLVLCFSTLNFSSFQKFLEFSSFAGIPFMKICIQILTLIFFAKDWMLWHRWRGEEDYLCKSILAFLSWMSPAKASDIGPGNKRR